VLVDPSNGGEASVAFNRLSSVFDPPTPANSTGQLMAIYWPPDTLGDVASAQSLSDRPHVRAFDVLALGWDALKGIYGGESDIHWTLPPPMGFAQHPSDQKEKYANKGPWVEKGKYIGQQEPASKKTGAVQMAKFYVTWRHNGYSVGYVTIKNVETKHVGKIYLMNLNVEGTIMPLPDTKRSDGKPMAAIEVTFRYEFKQFGYPDIIWIANLTLLGNGEERYQAGYTQGG
jgi:hypothetical protein